ncbi:putative acylesterase/phospholipase RssA [Arthrobacter sp. PvP023]|uniref:patatin-like phospholipase family protein n=2 Tax=Micrococcaceae TaxID=1268 RepID=UPI001B4B6E5B|nr:putative acylesterase/phospholipase RssA [Arthrobacter sp. PvP023]
MDTTARRMSAAGKRALVLGGGGSTGNAWVIGVIAGLFNTGLDVTTADLTIGTSAGSTAAAQIAGATPAELLAAVLAAVLPQRTGPARSDGGRVPIGPVADQMRRHPIYRRRAGYGQGRALAEQLTEFWR